MVDSDRKNVVPTCQSILGISISHKGDPKFWNRFQYLHFLRIVIIHLQPSILRK